ncbi:MAG: hypothetical protein RI931_528 [Actinomycetota bacterium]
MALISPTAYLTLSPINTQLGVFIGVFGTVLVIALLILLSPVIELTADTLRVGKAMIPTSALGLATPIRASDAFAERGPNLNARAFIKFQPTVKTLIKIEITDPQDPTPYLLFSTRRAEILANAINGLV